LTRALVVARIAPFSSENFALVLTLGDLDGLGSLAGRRFADVLSGRQRSAYDEAVGQQLPEQRHADLHAGTRRKDRSNELDYNFNDADNAGTWKVQVSSSAGSSSSKATP
jgi:hypothetical protein